MTEPLYKLTPANCAHQSQTVVLVQGRHGFQSPYCWRCSDCGARSVDLKSLVAGGPVYCEPGEEKLRARLMACLEILKREQETAANFRGSFYHEGVATGLLDAVLHVEAVLGLGGYVKTLEAELAKKDAER